MKRRRKQRGLSDDVSKNVKSTFSNENMIFYAEVIGVAIFSVMSSTLFKLKGWGAYALAYGIPAVIGMTFKRPAMFVTALAGASIHAGFWGGDKLLATNPIMGITNTWGIEQSGMNGMSDETQNYAGAGALPPGVQMVNLGGRMVAVEPRESLLNDYVRDGQEIGFSDYVQNGQEIGFSDYVQNGQEIGFSDYIQSDDAISFSGMDINKTF